MKRLDIQQIIAYLNTIPELTSLVSNRIFWGLPKTMQEWNSVAITEITDNIDEVDSFSRLEFRLIGMNDKTTVDELFAIERVITAHLTWSIQFWTVKTYKITLENNSIIGYDDKDRQIYVRDYTLFYTN